MTLKVMLVNPPVLSVLEPWYDTPGFGRVSLAYLAGALRRHTGYDVRILDSKLARLDHAEALEEIKSWQPDIVGLTAFTNEIKPAAYLAGLIKRELPDVVTVIGGVHLTALPEQTLEQFPTFDIGVVGEGEETFCELCDAIGAGADLAKVKGLVYRTPTGIALSPGRPRILDQDSIAFPAWDLFPRAERYFVHSLRGCPLNCVFCMNPNGRIARQRSVKNVIEELEWVIETFAPKTISFGDELFSVDMARTHELLDAMIKHRIGERVPWDIQTHVRFVDEALFVKMKKAGVLRVDLGIETGDEEKLKALGKGTNLKMIETARAAARKAGVPIGTFFLVGQPNETVASINKTIKLAVKMNADLPMFGIMTPYPGTEVARLAANGEAGYRLKSTDWEEYNKQIGGALEFADLSRRQIEILQVKAYAKVFLYNLRIVEFLKFVWRYQRGAWSVLKKVLRNSSMADLLKRPPDYDEVINSGTDVLADDIVQARMNWSDLQNQEMVRARQASRELPVV